jgi:5-methyltetrahydrofolate--homocysteine methyltransferase
VETILTSPIRQVIIGPRHPFVMVGERINPSGRRKLAADMEAGNFDRVKREALAQVEAGAQVIDVNAGIPLADEPALLAKAILAVQSVVDAPLCIDSSVVPALEAGLKVYRGKPLINSVTGEEERLESILSLAAAYGAAVIGIPNDERGICEDPNIRIAVARKIVERAERCGIPRCDVLIDPLAMPVGAAPQSVLVLLEVLRRVQEELGVNTILGASNVSFGMPDRQALNSAFLAMAIGAGLTSAILNPLDEVMRRTVLASDVLLDRDEYAMRWIETRTR